METEIWKDVIGYEGLYKASNLGNFKSVERKIGYNHHSNNERYFRLKKESKRVLANCKGYNIITFHKDDNPKTKRCCRIIAKLFVPNPDNKPHVNHINGIKTDDRAINLEWVTPSENMIHAVKNNLVTIKTGKDCFNSKKVKCLKTGKIFDTVSEASKYINLSQGQLSRILRGIYKNNTNLVLCQDV
ncbi:MAG: NUMOD4 domain-containing protein [Saprospiraceae bacterium]